MVKRVIIAGVVIVLLVSFAVVSYAFGREIRGDNPAYAAPVYDQNPYRYGCPYSSPGFSN